MNSIATFDAVADKVQPNIVRYLGDDDHSILYTEYLRSGTVAEKMESLMWIDNNACLSKAQKASMKKPSADGHVMFTRGAEPSRKARTRE